jgi:hypothetical protein
MREREKERERKEGKRKEGRKEGSKEGRDKEKKLACFLYLAMQFLPFEVGVFILCLSHHCILEANNLSGFIGLQLERICPQDGLYLRMIFKNIGI